MSECILLHKDICIPEKFKEISKMLQKNMEDFYYSQHMLEHLKNLTPDKSHKYFNGDIDMNSIDELIDSLTTTQRDVFEVELTKFDTKWVVTKYCCRIPYNDNQDLVVAIRPKKNKMAMVVTAWLNSTSDEHFTLDESKYVFKEELEAILYRR